MRTDNLLPDKIRIMPKNYQTSILNIPSRIENVRDVAPFLRDFCKKHNLDCEMHYGDMLLVLTEAVTNSIKHGNRLDPSKQVQIELSKHDCGKVSIQIVDEGQGFDEQQVPDPTQPQRITQPNGRGLYLMREIANKVDYSQKGRCCRIEF